MLRAASRRTRSVSGARGVWSRTAGALLGCILLQASTQAVAQVLPRSGTSTGSGVEPLPRQPRTGSVTPMASPREEVAKVLAIGRAQVVDGNIDSARSIALRQAYSEAVSRGAGIAVGSLTMIGNMRQVSDLVVSRSRGFIRRYDILGEGLTAEGKYEIRIEAEVLVDGVTENDEREGLSLYLKVLGDPRLLIMLPQYDVSGSSTATTGGGLAIEYRDSEGQLSVRRTTDPTPAAGAALPDQGVPDGVLRGAEAAIAQAFSRFGYQVLTSDDIVARGATSPQVLARARQGVTEDALAVARSVEADLILFGALRVSSREIAPHGVSFVSATAEASAKAIIVSSGHLLEAFHTTSTRAHPNPLAAQAAVLDFIAAEFASVLAWKIPQILANNPRESRLRLSGVNLDEAEKLRQSITGLPEIESARFSQLPSASNGWQAELVVQTGFVTLQHYEVLDICRDAVDRKPVVAGSPSCEGFALVGADKYQLRLRRCGARIL